MEIVKTSLTAYELSAPGRHGYKLPATDVEPAKALPNGLVRKEKAVLPELSELDVVRHYTNLSKMNFSVDTHFYPLGSCTMKYNPKFTEQSAGLKGFTGLHPLIADLPGGEALVQGAFAVIHGLEGLIAEITGMETVTTQPLAGAHGEMTGIMVIAAYHRKHGRQRKYVIVPDSSHGTNPASAAMAGYEIITIPSLPNGEMDFDAYKSALNDEVAAVMMTCPNTLGIFETRIKEIAELAHSVDALMYYDGANLNAIMGKVRPGDLGFDVVHVNVHKTFGTPHGGGGPGAGPVGVASRLVDFLPSPRIVKDDKGVFSLDYKQTDSIGRVTDFFGNFGILVRAYAYILINGKEGLIKASEQAVLNANYIQEKLKGAFKLPYDRLCMHECVFSAENLVPKGVRALDIAKYLIDQGYHPPTVYFPLNVKEAIMIEPTETESKETLDEFIAVMLKAADLAESNPALLQNAPVTMPITRLDETKAARELKVTCVC